MAIVFYLVEHLPAPIYRLASGCPSQVVIFYCKLVLGNRKLDPYDSMEGVEEQWNQIEDKVFEPVTAFLTREGEKN